MTKWQEFSQCLQIMSHFGKNRDKCLALWETHQASENSGEKSSLGLLRFTKVIKYVCLNSCCNWAACVYSYEWSHDCVEERIIWQLYKVMHLQSSYGFLLKVSEFVLAYFREALHPHWKSTLAYLCVKF